MSESGPFRSRQRSKSQIPRKPLRSAASGISASASVSSFSLSTSRPAARTTVARETIRFSSRSSTSAFRAVASASSSRPAFCWQYARPVSRSGLFGVTATAAP